MARKNSRQDQFQERLKRISAGGPNTSSQVYAGIVESRTPPKKAKQIKLPKTKAAKRATAGVPTLLVSGMIIGAAAVVSARYLRFQFDGSALTGPDSDLMMMIDLVVAITIAILLRIVIRFQSQAHGYGKAVGITAMILLMQNAVHFAPGLFEQTFSVAWVDQVLNNTVPDSVLLAGTSFGSADARAFVDQVTPLLAQN